MSLRGARDLIAAKPFLNNTSDGISTFFDEIRILRLCLYQHIVSFFTVGHIDLSSLRTLIELVSRFAIAVTLVNPGLGVRIAFSLCDRGGYCWCRCRGFGQWLYYWLTYYGKLGGTSLSPTGSSVDKGCLKGGTLLRHLSIFMAFFGASSTKNTS